MSAVYTVLCARPIDAEGQRLLAAAQVPFSVAFEEVAAWRASASAGPEADTPALAAWLGEAWATVVRIRVSPAHVELANQCAIELVAAFGGAYYDDLSWQPGLARAGVDRPDARNVLKTWILLQNNPAKVDEREHAEARREWAEAAARDPSYERDNDWSDV